MKLKNALKFYVLPVSILVLGVIFIKEFFPNSPTETMIFGSLIGLGVGIFFSQRVPKGQPTK